MENQTIETPQEKIDRLNAEALAKQIWHKLNSPIIIQSEIKTDNIRELGRSENKEQKIVSVSLFMGTDSKGEAIRKNLVLWKDAEYDAIGQYTDTDVANRIKQLLQ